MWRDEKCILCGGQLRCAKNEVAVIGRDGVTCWSGDLYKCMDCGEMTVMGLGGDMDLKKLRAAAQAGRTREKEIT